MLGEIGAGLTSLKALGDLIKGLSAAHTQASIDEVKVALLKALLDAHTEADAHLAAKAAMAQRNHQLEQEIARLDDWDLEKSRYALMAIDRGAVAYMLKPGLENGEPPHWLCANCFSRRQKSYLQFKTQNTGAGGRRGDQAVWGCDACKASVSLSYTRSPG